MPDGVDDLTKEYLVSSVAFGISALRTTLILDSIAPFRGYSAMTGTGQSLEFIWRAMGQWAFEHGVELRRIQPDKLTHNEFIDSFNGRFRIEYLNEH